MNRVSIFKAIMGAATVFTLAIVAPYSIASVQQLEPLPNLRADLERFVGKENPGRLKVLSQLLKSKGISSHIESYEYKKSEVFADKEDISADEKKLWDALSNNNKGENLIVTLGAGEKTIVLGAHYDRVPQGDGVVDNASSSIILVRLAEALKHQSLNYQLKIVWFGDEEIDLIGSKKFVKTHKDQNIVSMINLDVNAYGDATMMGPTKYTGENRLYDMAKKACRKHNFKFVEFPEYGESDNESFTAVGIESISIGIAPVAEAYEFWLALNADKALKPKQIPRLITNIHSERDAMSRIDVTSITQSYWVVFGILEELNKLP